MKYLIILASIIFFACNTFASPDLDNYQDIAGIRIYTDHLKNNLFYLTPARPVLGTGQNNRPGFSLQIYRYLGRKGTGDSGKFWVRGILNINIKTDRGKKTLKQIKKKISERFNIKYPRLRSMPVAKTQGKLFFADKNIKWSQAGRWTGKKMTIPLDNIMSQILWDAVKKGQTLISIEVQEYLFGVKKNHDHKWEEAQVPFSFTLPVKLDMAAYPQLFSKTDIGGRMARGYTGIDVFCFDFIEHADENLYAKVVEIAIPTPGKPLVESVTFRKNNDCRTRIKFKLAKDLDTGYRVRITRIFQDGSSKAGPWIQRMGEAMLDVTDCKDTDL